jgi:DUF4097 and DUF4098 domain-containing protein YvlB
MSFENIEQTFNVTSPAQLKLGNISGSVDIQTGEDGIIHVLAVRCPGNCDAEHTTIELLQAEDGSVSINTRFDEGSLNCLWGSQVCEVEYMIKAPRLCSINVNVVSSSINVKGFEGTFSFKSVSGDMSLKNLSGSLTVETVSGDISGQDLVGSSHMKSVSGDINLQASSLPSVNANMVSGDVVLHTDLAEGPYKFHTVSGDVHLLVPAASQFNVDLHSVSGDFTTNFPLTHSSQSTGRQSASVGTGGAAITLTSVSGDLQVESEGEIPPVPEVNKLDILSKLENGELSVDEALIQLNS